MSRFVRQQTIGDPLEFELIERDEPHPGPGEIRVRVHAAGLNPVDSLVATVPQVAEMFGVSAPTGFGNDFAGVVDEVGEGVTGVAVGDRVFGGARARAVAEHVVVAASDVFPTPDGLDDERAGALPIAGRTADAVVAALAVRQGEAVLVGGAAGGVGVLVVQLLAAQGATVIATASEANHEFLRSLGATPVAYGDGLADRVRSLAAVTAAADLHGTDTVEAAIELGVEPSRIVTIAAAPQPPHGAIATGGTAAAPDALPRIAALLADGSLQLPISATFPIERLDEAVALQRGGHVRGKVVVTI